MDSNHHLTVLETAMLAIAPHPLAEWTGLEPAHPFRITHGLANRCLTVRLTTPLELLYYTEQ